MPAQRGNKHGRQFPKGNPGGPGKPKGYRAPTTVIREYLAEHPDLIDRIVATALGKAEEGDFQFYKYLCDRLEGVPTQHLNAQVGVTLNLSDEQRERLDKIAEMIAKQA